jgi:diguanylate cyclase (GGDEF)-like protein
MKILLVEDTRTVAAVMAARLSAFGYEVRIAANGQIAVDAYREWQPDLVLMDIEMPVMNGFEATNRIRAYEATREWAWTPILFLTASDTPENLVTAIEAGGDDFLAKSVPEAVLQAKMKALSRIAELRRRLAMANRKLAETASRDGLTGLRNRRSMDLETDAAWYAAVQAGRSLGLLMIDVDHFKKYNDHYGHLVGDDCLRAIAGALAATVEAPEHALPGAFAARYGGEEFAVIVPDATPALLAELSTRLLTAVQGLAIPHALNTGYGVVTISVGGACRTPAAGELASVFRLADERLYRVKETGRNRALVDD